MLDTLKIRELAIVVAAQNHNPTILNPDFLKHSKIVPQDWELAKGDPPICVEPFAQVAYSNGVNIVAQPDKIVFREVRANGITEESYVPQIAQRYTEILPHVGYSAVGINPQGFVSTQNQTAAQKFLVDKAIADGPWKTFQGKEARVTAKFTYPLDSGSFNLDIQNVILRQDSSFGVIFAGNFHRDIAGSSHEEKVKAVVDIVGSWRDDLRVFRSFAEETFLTK